MVRRIGVPPELNYSYIQYLKVILRRRVGKVDPARSFMLSQRRETPFDERQRMQHPPDGFVFDQYINLAVERFHTQEPWPGALIAKPTLKRADKMRHYGGFK